MSQWGLLSDWLKNEPLNEAEPMSLLQPQTMDGFARPARDGVSREVPWSALKGETVPDSLPATLWLKAQHEGALPPPCIVRKDPRVPHTARRGA